MDSDQSLEEMRKHLEVKQDSFIVGFISGGVAACTAE